ncbi:MAG: cysteine desulfurase family protein [Planctomycetota bacterium]
MNDLDPELYFDCNGSTPVHPQVVDAAIEHLRGTFGNASAAHAAGLAARAVIQRARGAVARALGAYEDEVFFTSGGTESNNLALRGALEPIGAAHGAAGGHVIVGRHEHGSVVRTVEWAERRGHDVTWLAPDAGGRLRVEDIAAALRPDTRIVALMFANNETGALQPVAEVGRLLAGHPALFLVDAVCGVGKARVDVRELGCDLLSFGGHKVHAPKGVGALYVRRGVALAPQIHGCGQQGGLRSGTENTTGVVALGRAMELMHDGGFGAFDEVAAATERLWEGLTKRFPDVQRNGTAPFLANTLNVWFPGVPALDLQARLAARGASVASSASRPKGLAPGAPVGAGEPSHVLLAMGHSPARATESIRFSLGHGSTCAGVERLLALLDECLAARSGTMAARAPSEPDRLSLAVGGSAPTAQPADSYAL